MPKRITSKDFAKLVSRVGYGVPNAFGKGTANDNRDNKWSEHDVERNSCAPLEGQKSLKVNYAGTPTVRVTFHRHRLADHNRSISEKALIDALQYCGAIRGDSEKEIRLCVEDQIKVGSKAEEKTVITIEYPEVDFDNLFVAEGRTDGR